MNLTVYKKGGLAQKNKNKKNNQAYALCPINTSFYSKESKKSSPASNALNFLGFFSSLSTDALMDAGITGMLLALLSFTDSFSF